MFASISVCGGTALKYYRTILSNRTVSIATDALNSERRVAGKISGYTHHGLNQAISRDGVGVRPSAILDTMRNPINVVERIDDLGRVSKQFRGV